MQLLSIKELQNTLGVSRTTLWRMEKECKDFPKKRYISKNRVAYLKEEVETWIKESIKPVQ